MVEDGHTCVLASLIQSLNHFFRRVRVREHRLVPDSNPLIGVPLPEFLAVCVCVLAVGLVLAPPPNRSLDTPEGLEQLFRLFLRKDPSHLRMHPVCGRRGSGTGAHLHPQGTRIPHPFRS